jgi:hypothetical protein
MNDTIISWNVPNWITIVIMAAIGIAILGVIEKIVVQAKGAA